MSAKDIPFEGKYITIEEAIVQLNYWAKVAELNSKLLVNAMSVGRLTDGHMYAGSLSFALGKVNELYLRLNP